MIDLDVSLDRWLRAGAGRGEPCERKVETSISWVYLYPSFVLKLKKPVDFGFVDFTTLSKRHRAVERELELNSAAAPDIYRAAHPIVRTGDDFSLGGGGEAVEWALEMRRFDEGCVLSERPDAVTGDLAELLGREIAATHAAAPVGRRFGGAEGLRSVLATNASNLRELVGKIDAGNVEALVAEAQRALDAATDLLDARRASGFVRRCHGDLHLGNILLEDGRPILFDCIEFSERLAEIDVLYDLAFLLMDLDFRGQAVAANRVMNAWLDEAARAFGDDVWAGLAALPLFLSARAAVRAHVSGHAGDFTAARSYLEAARTHLESTRPSLVAIGGLSGSGKTTVARLLAPCFGARPGAVLLRSDEVRKRLWGRSATQKLPPEAYVREASTAVYAKMLELAKLCIAAGRSVILDAVFLRPAEREAVEALCAGLGAPFTGVWLQAPPSILQARVEARVGDASDADASVVARQLGEDPGKMAWWAIEAERSETAVAEISACIALT